MSVSLWIVLAALAILGVVGILFAVARQRAGGGNVAEVGKEVKTTKPPTQTLVKTPMMQINAFGA